VRYDPVEMMMLWNPLDPARGPPPYRLADEPGSATGQDDRGDLDQIGEDQNIIEQMLLELLELRQ